MGCGSCVVLSCAARALRDACLQPRPEAALTPCYALCRTAHSSQLAVDEAVPIAISMHIHFSLCNFASHMPDAPKQEQQAVLM